MIAVLDSNVAIGLAKGSSFRRHSSPRSTVWMSLHLESGCCEAVDSLPSKSISSTTGPLKLLTGWDIILFPLPTSLVVTPQPEAGLGQVEKTPS